MLHSLLYHRVGSGKYANPLTFFEKHFAWVENHFQTVHPGDPLEKKSLCLTFDDALFDFYHHIFPLLQKHQIKAVLSVPVSFIPEEVKLSPEERLEKVATLPDKPPPLPSPAYCTWDELRAMHQSGLVHLASHSINHLPLTSPLVDPEYELLSSKIMLEKQLKTPVTTFVYPYGKLSSTVHKIAKKHYPYIMRIGNAVNFSWGNAHQLIYRINADALPHPLAPFTPLSRTKHLIKYLLNTLRRCK